MAIPQYSEMYNIFLLFLKDKNKKSINNIRTEIIEKYKISEEEQTHILKSGRNLLSNRVGWTSTYLLKAGAIKRIERGIYQITDVGLDLLKENILITNEVLSRFKTFTDFNGIKKGVKLEPTNMSGETPLEEIESSITQLNIALQDTILEELLKQTPTFLENLATKLLTKMGYGKQENSIVTQKTADGGIDGIVLEDELGINNIYIQTKRYDKDNSISRPELQKFYGAMADESVKKGVFITTSYFSKPAIEYATKNSIILIDGNKLSSLMLKYNIGCTTENIYEIKKLDSDFFENI